jgi:predicted metal-dependent HD superfamily phosphohydrolase
VADDAELRTAWARAAGSSAEAQAAFDEVVGRHRQPHRRYHGVRHVTWVVRHVHELVAHEPVDDVDAVVVAAFFHDAVYDPTMTDNEEQSAALASRVLGELGWPSARIATVGRLVAATQRHEATTDADTNVLIDADLAVLGTDPAPYQDYVTGVRAEYGHVDDVGWRAGRSAVLRALLDRQPLYTTPTGRQRWEARARANLTSELATLVDR